MHTNIKKILILVLLVVCFLQVSVITALAAKPKADPQLPASVLDDEQARNQAESDNKDAVTPQGAPAPAPVPDPASAPAPKPAQSPVSGNPPSPIPDSFNVNQYLTVPGQKSRVPSKTADPTKESIGVTKFILDGIDLFIKLIGSIALVVFIIGALLTIASEGKEDLLEKGKTTMVYAVIGVIVSLMAFIIVTFVQSVLF